MIKKHVILFYRKNIIKRINVPRKKKNPTSDSSMMTNISITLPVSLITKIQNLDISGTGSNNTSKTIRCIVENFLDENGAGEVYIPQKGEVLVPIKNYEELASVGRLTLKNRAAKGEIKIITSFGNEYVVVDKDNIFNIFAQMLLYKEEVKNLRQKFQDLESSVVNMDIEKRLNALELKTAKK